MKIKMTTTVVLEATSTELQMLYEAVCRTKPFAEMSREMLHISAGLERELHDAVLKLPE
jgi:hypothetical protein